MGRDLIRVLDAAGVQRQQEPLTLWEGQRSKDAPARSYPTFMLTYFEKAQTSGDLHIGAGRNGRGLREGGGDVNGL